MMRLVVKEMEQRRPALLPRNPCPGVCVVNRQIEKIAVDVVERFDARVLFDARCAKAVERRVQDGIQWWCRV
jgi:hypothetical protein